MSRPLRIELAGGLYHVTARGDGREAIYRADADREAWLREFGRVCERFNWICHAYCQMTNHYHAVVETPDANLARGMRQLNGIYTQYVNRTHQRVGHVFQGRYKAILIEKDSYLMELARYVVLNPVRAGMVADARNWRWSSYQAMIGEAPAAPWLETDWMLGQFGAQRRRAIAAYIDFVRAGVGLPGLWTQLRSQIYLGSERFVTRMQKQVTATSGLAEVPRAQRRPVARDLDHYQRKWADPRKGMALAYASGDYTMKAIADHFDVHYSTVSRAVKHRENNH